MSFFGTLLYGAVTIITAAYMTIFPISLNRQTHATLDEKIAASFFDNSLAIGLESSVQEDACERIEFVKDVTYPDGTEISADKSFIKTWQIRNTGCDITDQKQAGIVYVDGTMMGATAYELPEMKSGEVKEISVRLESPPIPGEHRVTYMPFVMDEGKMRIFGQELWAQIYVPGLSEESKFIIVDLSQQRVYAFLDGDVKTFTVSTGVKGRETDYTGPMNPTYIWYKTSVQDMDGRAYGYDYFLPDVQWNTFFNMSGEAFHGTYWHNDFGRPKSSGCVNMRTADAKWIFDHYFIGDAVYIVYSIDEFPLDFFSGPSEITDTVPRKEYLPKHKIDIIEMR